MTDHKLQFESQLDHYSQVLSNMQQHVITLEYQLLDMLQIQFGKLAEAITETLHLPQEQATILRGLVDEHLHQLTVTAQLRPPRGPQGQPQSLTPATALVHGNLPPQSVPPRQHSRDPRITRPTPQVEG